MKVKGLMNLKTNGGERKMHYAIIDNKIYTSTGSDTNKIDQIKADSVVSIDKTDCSYNARILEGNENQEMLEVYRNNMGKMNKLINMYLGSKTPVLIELTEIA